MTNPFQFFHHHDEPGWGTTYSRSPAQVPSISLSVAIPWWMRARLTSVGSSHASSPTGLPPSWAPLPWSQASYDCRPPGNSVCSECLRSLCSACVHCAFNIVSGSETLFVQFISPPLALLLPPLPCLHSPLPLFSLHSFSASSSPPSSTLFCPSPSLLSYSTTLLTGAFWRSFSILTWPQ